MSSIFIFAGTKEGRLLSEILCRNGFDCTVSVATEYGAGLLPEEEGLTVLQGRMNAEEMAKAFADKSYEYIIDATHPFATEVSREIKKACSFTGGKYIRLARDCSSEVYTAAQTGKSCQSALQPLVYCSCMNEAAEKLEQLSGNIFVSTGSKELPLLAEKISDKSRLFVRVLPSVESLEICKKSGILQKNIIAMQGPFSQKMNEIQFSESSSSILLTKESGNTGGFFEKIQAAQNLGLTILVIKNPEKKEEITEGKNEPGEDKSEGFYETFSTLDDVLERVAGKELARQHDKKILSLIGIGMGNKKNLTNEAEDILKGADVIFGARRMLETARTLDYSPDSLKPEFVPLYKHEEIFTYLEENKQYKKAAVMFSGDTGFYSGAEAFFEESEQKGGQLNLFYRNEVKGWQINVLPGISSAIYFASKLNKSWHKWKMLSLHGCKCNIIEEIRKNPACFFILSGESDVNMIAEKIEEAEQNRLLSDVSCFLGENLSYGVEKIIHFNSVSEMKNYRSEGVLPKNLCVLLIENNKNEKESLLPLLSDEDFIRKEKIPMTKKEIRQLSLCALRLSKNSVVYDIGSGSGSITVEAARIADEGRVFAIDVSEEAYFLTQKNVSKFSLMNVTCLLGSASDIIRKEKLPLPTHAFIGGSRGSISDLCHILIERNPDVRIVANFVSLEGLCDMKECLKSLEKEGIKRKVEIKQISVAAAEQAGKFHLMKAQNPVWIVSF